MVLTSVIHAVDQLKERVYGRVLTPEDQDYNTIRRGWNLATDHHPALILVARTAQDVVAGVQFAREAGLGISVQSTGHGIQQPADEALLIVTSQMKAVSVDAEARTLRVEAGVQWHQVIEAAAPYGLAPLLGSSPYVGVMGYTLGGGLGWLARPYGLAADSVRWIDVVTPDGVLRHADSTENSELFWGLRGGGGNFGVVTAMSLNLYPVARLYGGFMIYPGERAGEALRFFRDWVKTVPDELTSSINIMKFPNVPQLPEAMRGKIMVFVRATYTGNASDGEALMQPWLDWNTPMQSSFRDMPFAEIGTVSNDPVEPGEAYGSNEMFDELSDEAIDLITKHATNPESSVVIHELRHGGGAVQKADPNINAVGNRDAQFFFQIAGPIFEEGGKAKLTAYIQQIKADLQPYFKGGVYQNFMSGGESINRAKDAYSPESYQRLLALKAKFDPENLFRFSYQLVK